jgi:hypothetical protein
MVMSAGTDSQYDKDIPVRVSHLESSVAQLHTDNQRAQTMLAGIVAQQDAHSRLLADISAKLDQTRTQKPNLLGLAVAVLTLVGLMFSYGELKLAPIYRDLTEATVRVQHIDDELDERGKLISSMTGKLEHVEDRQRTNENRLLLVEANRFTKQDGQTLEQSLRTEIRALQERP